jgi:hypothetical protein
LRFKVHARELGAEQLQLLDTDLSCFVSQPAAAGAGPLSNGHQTMAIAAVYTVSFSDEFGLAHCILTRQLPHKFSKACCMFSCTYVLQQRTADRILHTADDCLTAGEWLSDSNSGCKHWLQTPQGWTLSFDCSTFSKDHWGLLLPELRQLLQRWPMLSAAEHGKNLNQQAITQHNQQQHIFIDCRKGSDYQVATLASHLWPARHSSIPYASQNEKSGAEEAVVPADSDADQQSGSQGGSDDTLKAHPTSANQPKPAELAPAATDEPVSTDRLLLQLGWELFKPADEEDEPPGVDFSISVYNLQVCVARRCWQSVQSGVQK